MTITAAKDINDLYKVSSDTAKNALYGTNTVASKITTPIPIISVFCFG